MKASSLNVFLIVEATFPPPSRANLRLFKLAQALVKRQYCVHMISPSMYPFHRERGSYSNISIVQYLGIGRLLYSRFLRLFVRSIHLIASVFIVTNQCRKAERRILHAWHPIAAFSAIVAGRLTHTPVYVDWTDFYSDIAAYESPFATPIFRAIEAVIINNSHGIITVTEEMKEALVRLGAIPTRIKVVSDGVDSKMFNPRIDGAPIRDRYKLNRSPLLMFHGDIKPMDGLDVLLRALLEVVRGFPNIRVLVVGGGGKYFEEIKKRTSVLGLDNHVIFTGWIPHAMVPVYIAAADVGVMPLRSTVETNCYLSFKLFEYWAMAKPVIVSDVKAISRLVIDGINGYVAESGSSRSFSHALCRVLGDLDSAKLMGLRGRELVEQRFDWEKLMTQEADLYPQFGY